LVDVAELATCVMESTVFKMADRLADPNFATEVEALMFES